MDLEKEYKWASDFVWGLRNKITPRGKTSDGVDRLVFFVAEMWRVHRDNVERIKGLENELKGGQVEALESGVGFSSTVEK